MCINFSTRLTILCVFYECYCIICENESFIISFSTFFFRHIEQVINSSRILIVLTVMLFNLNYYTFLYFNISFIFLFVIQSVYFLLTYGNFNWFFSTVHFLLLRYPSLSSFSILYIIFHYEAFICLFFLILLHQNVLFCLVTCLQPFRVIHLKIMTLHHDLNLYEALSFVWSFSFVVVIKFCLLTSLIIFFSFEW
jgi:hypothetical protein